MKKIFANLLFLLIFISRQEPLQASGYGGGGAKPSKRKAGDSTVTTEVKKKAIEKSPLVLSLEASVPLLQRWLPGKLKGLPTFLVNCTFDEEREALSHLFKKPSWSSLESKALVSFFTLRSPSDGKQYFAWFIDTKENIKKIYDRNQGALSECYYWESTKEAEGTIALVYKFLFHPRERYISFEDITIKDELSRRGLMTVLNLEWLFFFHKVDCLSSSLSKPPLTVKTTAAHPTTANFLAISDDDLITIKKGYKKSLDRFDQDYYSIDNKELRSLLSYQMKRWAAHFDLSEEQKTYFSKLLETINTKNIASALNLIFAQTHRGGQGSSSSLDKPFFYQGDLSEEKQKIVQACSPSSLKGPHDPVLCLEENCQEENCKRFYSAPVPQTKKHDPFLCHDKNCQEEICLFIASL